MLKRGDKVRLGAETVLETGYIGGRLFATTEEYPDTAAAAEDLEVVEQAFPQAGQRWQRKEPTGNPALDSGTIVMTIGDTAQVAYANGAAGWFTFERVRATLEAAA